MKVEIVEKLDKFPYRNPKAVSEEEFVNDLFYGLDLCQLNAPMAPMFFTGTHIIKLYYSHLQTTVTLFIFSTEDLSAKIKPLSRSNNSTLNLRKPSKVQVSPIRIVQNYSSQWR